MMLIESFMIGISTYSVIPVPNFEWNERNMKYSICFFPVVGIICGICMWALGCIGDAVGMSGFFAAAIAVCIPIFITGGIHMDGYMDTVDAISSHQSMEIKLEILKDPHCGAFAVIYCGVYLLSNLAFLYEIYSACNIALLCPVYVLSRCLSGLCAVNMPKARNKGMLYSYTKDVGKNIVNAVMAAAAIVCGGIIVAISPAAGGISVGLGLLWTIAYCRIAKKQFGGVTGDTAGFFLQIFELVCMAGIWAGAMI